MTLCRHTADDILSMSKYTEKDYTLHKALENIGDYFRRLYRDDLRVYAQDRPRKDILQRIREQWDNAARCNPFGTDIRIEWAMAIYDHGDWERSLPTSAPDYHGNPRTTDPRRRYPAEYRCDNGTYVRSLSELCIANRLYANRITFEYERAVVFESTSEQAHCDFYLSDKDVYVEFWGMCADPAYANYKQWKEALYLQNRLRLLSLYPNDLKNLRDSFTAAMRFSEICVLRNKSLCLTDTNPAI